MADGLGISELVALAMPGLRPERRFVGQTKYIYDFVGEYIQ